MDFIRNILIIDKATEEANELKKLVLETSQKFNVFTLNARLKLAEVATKNNIKCLFLNANIGKNDAFYVLRFFYMNKEKNGEEIPVFLTAEDFDFFQEVLQEFPFKNLTILPSPIDLKDVVNKIQLATLGKIAEPEKAKTVSNNKLHVDMEFMNVFIQNTKKILSEMGQVSDLKHSPPKLMSQIKEPLEIAISAKILISSVYFKGSYYIAFPKETFLNLYEKVVMEKCADITDENKDFAGELANIIYGQCKKKFSDSGLNLEMVIPSIHVGEIRYSVVVLIPFDCSLGRFYLAVAPGLI